MPEIEYAFLADAVDAPPGQKFSVLGGGVSRLTGPTFPFQHPHIALVVGLRLTSVERRLEHDLQFVITGPTGDELAVAGGKMVAHGPAEPNDIILTLGVDFWNLAFPTAGEYAVRILINNSERKRLPLYVGQGPREAAAPEQRYLA